MAEWVDDRWLSCCCFLPVTSVVARKKSPHNETTPNFSGQQVLGPSSSGRSREDMITKVFDAARAHGAETLTPEENAVGGTQSAVKFGSGSVGYRLGDSHRPSESVPPEQPVSEQPEQVSRFLILVDFLLEAAAWQNIAQSKFELKSV